jgi:hypothetical protein
LVVSQGYSIGRTHGYINSYYAVGNFDTSAGGNFGTNGVGPNGYLEGSNIGASGNTLYFSFLYATQSGDTQTGAFEFLRGGNSDNSNLALGISVTATTAPSSASLYVGEIVFGASDSDTLYGATNPASVGALSQVGGVGNYSFDRMELKGTSDFQLDEIRVGSTFADVVPEPTSIALLGLGSLGLLVRRRRA